MIKKELFFFLLFVLIISLSQFLILKPHLEFGFTPDDVRFFSDFSALDSPIRQIKQAWLDTGIYQTPHLYYGGIIFSLFGFNFFSYHVTSLIFKILSIITFYLLIQIVFKNRLLSFVSGLIFSFQYASFGSMEMVTRTQDYLLITGLNIFCILFYLTFTNKLKGIIWLIFSSLLLFLTFIINPARSYPLLPFICFFGIAIFLNKRTWLNFYSITKHLLFFFSPFFLFYILTGSSGGFYGNSLTIIQKIIDGNLQMLLAPFSSFGSLFLQNDSLRFLSSPTWSLNDFLNYFLGGPLIFFGIITMIISKILFKKSLKFFLKVFTVNFFAELLTFLFINVGRNLPENLKMTYDAYTFTPTAVLGIFVVVLTLFIFIEWLHDKGNGYLLLYLLGVSFTITFIWFTWIVYSLLHIPMGIYGYSTIPSLGISAAIASLFTLAYERIKNQKGQIKILAPFVFLIMLLYFLYSNNQIQTYWKANMDYGNKASDQIYITNKFWNFLKDDSNPCINFFFLKTTPNEQSGLNYSFIMIDRFDRWYSLYSPYHSKEPCPVALLVNEEDKLLSSYTNIEGKEGFSYNYFNGGNNFFPLEDFYAFKLQNRDIIDIKEEILEKIRQGR